MTGSPKEDDLGRETAVNFICGVVEGFYGRPWTAEQRKLLFKWMSRLGMNTYTYAPKDDYKHRVYWRELYSIEEADNLTSLIHAAHERNVTFVYAISPGLDITYSSSKDVTFLKRKLEQVSSFGCKAFALLFDDIDLEMCEADKSIYQSPAHAHVSLTNEIYQHLDEPMFLFCPTEYCAARAVPSVTDSVYLTIIGSKLLPAVQVMWTGPKVVSRRLTIESLDEVTKVLKRPPLIWDNIHANDYDPKRLFLGPYEGRSPEIIPYITGVLTNPNCEFEANFVAFHTLAQWRRSNTNGVKKDSISVDGMNPVATDIKLEKEEIEEVVEPVKPVSTLDGDDEDDDDEGSSYDERYEPRVALRSALGDWVTEFYIGRQPIKPLLSPLMIIDPTAILTPELNITGIKTCLVVTEPTVIQTQACTLKPTTTNSVSQPVPSIIGLDSEDVYMQPECINSLMGQHTSFDDQTSDVVDNPQLYLKTTDLEPMDLAVDDLGLPATLPPTAKTKTSETDMQIDPDYDSLKPSGSYPRKDFDPLAEPLPAHLPSQLTAEHLELLVDLFYMPFEHGSTGIKMLNLFFWLKTHSHFMHHSKEHKYTDDEIKEWKEKAERFSGFVDSLSRLAAKLANIPNRALLYDLFPYIWDIKGILSACNGYTKWLERGLVPYANTSLMASSHFWFSKSYKQTLIGGAQEPWMFRGGLQAEFHRLLPVEVAHDLFMIRPPDIIDLQEFHIRPYQLSDEPKIYEICSQIWHSSHRELEEVFKPWPELIGDRLVGGLTALSYEYCFVVEDSMGVMGYCLCTLDAKLFHQKYVTAWLPAMCQKYAKPGVSEEERNAAEEMIDWFHHEPPAPSDFINLQHPSVIDINYLPSLITDKSITKRLLICALSALRTNLSQGVYCVVEAADTFMYDLYCKLGFFHIEHMNAGGDAQFIYMGRRLI